MTMFTTPCFIRKNTPELRKKLIELGYKDGDGIYRKYISINKKLFAYQYPMKDFDTPYFVAGDSLDLTQVGLLKNKFIDCGENGDLFLAIAALRDDSDYMQWLTCAEVPEFTLCTKNSIDEHFMDSFPNELYRKATVEELIEHFKK